MRVACLILILSLWPIGAARAEEPNPLIGQGASFYEELRYEEALQTLSAALVRAGNSDADEAAIYRLLAFTYLSLDRPEEAEGAYVRLLVRNPEFEPDRGLAPRFREFFAGVKARWIAAGRPGFQERSPAPVAITHRSPAEASPGQEQRLEAGVDDPDGRVARLDLAYRQGTNAVFERAEAQRAEGGFVAMIPAEAVSPPLVEYYFEALDAAGLPVAALGDISAPLRIAVPEPSGSIVEQWWFWTIIGVAVAGAGATTAILLTQPNPTTPTGTFNITIR